MTCATSVPPNTTQCSRRSANDGETRTDPVVARGQKVFFQHCHQCHPHGQGGLGPAIVNKPLPEFLMKFQVRHGLGTMPSFGAEKIPPSDLEALMAYLKAVRGNPPLPEGTAAKS